MDSDRYISDLISYSQALYERRLVHASGGNTSVRVGDEVWITQTGAVLGELHQAVAELAPDYHVILLRQHGVTVGAKDMSQAMGILEELEQCCQIALLTAGKGVVLTDDQKKAIDGKLGREWK